MSLIDEIRGKDKVKEKVVREYSPMFLNVVKRTGYFIMSSETFHLETMTCIKFHEGGKTFLQWLEENELKTYHRDDGTVKIYGL